MSQTSPVHPLLQVGEYPTPAYEGIFSPKSLVLYVLNILTLGIYASTEAISKQHKVKRLTVEQGELLHNLSELNEDWVRLEGDLKSLRTLLQKTYGNKSKNKYEIKTGLQAVESRVKILSKQHINETEEHIFGMSQYALDVINFVGQLIGNLCTLGLYGLLQNVKLKNQIIELNAQNDHLIAEADALNKMKHDDIIGQISYYNDDLSVRTTDEKEVLGEVAQTKQQIAELQKKMQEAAQQAASLKAEKAAAEARLQQTQNQLNLANANFNAQRQAATQYRLQAEQAQAQAHQRDQEKAQLQNLATQKDGQINAVRNQLALAQQKAKRVDALEAEVQHYKATQAKLPEAQKLHAELGPIPPKYKPTKEDGEIKGAIDDDHALHPEFAQDYNKRYGTMRTAAEVVTAGFTHAYRELLDQAGEKIKLNKSWKTPETVGRFAIFNYMVLDLLKGAKLHKPSCDGFELQINDCVSMQPSDPHKVLQFKEEAAGVKKPLAILQYRRRDDFTPHEDILLQRDGVDPVGAAWILAKLSDAEKEHLLNLLLSDVIENTHPDLVATRAFMKQMDNPRVPLIATAYELITDMSKAIELKFRQTSLIPCWQEMADDYEADPFVKEEDQVDLNKVEDIDLVMADRTKFVEWKLDVDVLGDKRVIPNQFNYPYAIPPVPQMQQPDFLDLITFAKFKYDAVFKQLPALLVKKFPVGQEYDQITFDIVNQQYHVSHQMIGASQENEWKGGDRCLFSNLLAVLVADKKDLTSANVSKLKKAMANYLDKPEHAQEFKAVIQSTYHCTVAQYQVWLRGLPAAYNQQAGGWIYAPPVDLNVMTPLEISLAAWTVGVRIGILPIKLQAKTVVDANGMIMPVGQFYGPNTRECLLMGAIEGSYYGLFPKLNLDAAADDFDFVQAVENYWAKGDGIGIN